MNAWSWIVALALLCPLAAGANQAERKQSELDALKSRLQTLQKEFQSTQSHRREAADELKSTEQAVSAAVRQLRQIEAARQQTESTLGALRRQIQDLSADIEAGQRRLAHTLKTSHLRGEGDALKHILNGSDPNQTARDLRYLAALSRAQQAQVAKLRTDLARLAELEQQAEEKTAALQRLRTARAAEQERLMNERRAREALLQKLSAQIQQQGREIETLKRNERALTQLVERLNRVMAEQAARAAQKAREARKPDRESDGRVRKPVAVITATPEAFRADQPFSRLKGSLRLPVAGELMNRFGAPREGGGVSWKGLFIRAGQGSAVKAIAAGQVVFSDWLRGFGNLIIIDHGEGYMSLYSNNESLYKQVGERVRPGDSIASVGNSGGQPDTGLYFEMRHQSRPVNPMLWVE
ncbi:MAG: peptidoglycan DD-metalloendopeptidase family protein [Thiobacillus sp.]|nr:peptidoglycan DD-metalloendopeptidase family protein [Thiobacillus sp.]